MTDEEKRKMDRLLLENKISGRLIISRNKLIDELLVELPLTDRLFKKGMEMRDRNWANDKVIWDEIQKEMDAEIKEPKGVTNDSRESSGS